MIVQQLGARGAQIVAQDLDGAGLERERDNDLITSSGDLTAGSYRSALVDLCQSRGVDTVILAHGVEGAGALHQLDDGRVRRVMSINATSVVALTQSLLPQLRERQGVVVIVASQAGLQGEPNLAAYCASKFALVGWARRLSAVLAADGVQLRLLCPGCTRTPLLMDSLKGFAAAANMSLDQAVAERVSRIAVGRIADAEETAAAAVYLADRSAPRPPLLAATGGEVLC